MSVRRTKNGLIIKEDQGRNNPLSTITERLNGIMRNFQDRMNNRSNRPSAEILDDLKQSVLDTPECKEREHMLWAINHIKLQAYNLSDTIRKMAQFFPDKYDVKILEDLADRIDKDFDI